MESVYPGKKRRAGERRQLDGYGGGRKTIRRPTIPGELCAASALSESLCCTFASNSTRTERGGFELLEISLNVLLINLERLKGMKCLKVYGGFGNLKMKFEVG